MSDYKRNPRGARRARKSMGRKAIVVLSLMMVLVLAAVGGTVAWLTATTGPVTNTFTTSDINITLSESPNLDLKMVPGHTITKDPVATVQSESEPAWLFVKIDKSTNYSTYLEDYVIADGWERVEDGVYGRKVEDPDSNVKYQILKNNQVQVKDSVTKSDMQALAVDGAEQPSLTFTAYAVQLYKTNGEEFTITEAWQKAKPADPVPAPAT